ncbi:hypothetical protein [Bradyrhizobium sp. BR 1432]|uniref:hypothetical protein n=1 Tax=Bradyrhizobium sp. BR 1432 TaxID=3447966 RepID=UPI003EE5D8F6
MNENGSHQSGALVAPQLTISIQRLAFDAARLRGALSIKLNGVRARACFQQAGLEDADPSTEAMWNEGL